MNNNKTSISVLIAIGGWAFAGVQSSKVKMIDNTMTVSSNKINEKIGE